MSRQFVYGYLLIAVLGSISTQLALPYVNAIATRDIKLRTVACIAETMVQLSGGIPYGAVAPRCEGDFTKMNVTGFSFAPQSKAERGEQLLCDFVQHNDWYFTWDNRGHGWSNDKTYSFENCRAGRLA